MTGQRDHRKPDAIVIGIPGLPAGIASTTCDKCGERYRIQISTATTLAQTGTTRPPVVCYSCMAEMGGIERHEQVGNREARRRMGLDN